MESAFPLNIRLVVILAVIDKGLVKLWVGGRRAYKLARGGVAYKQQFSSLQYTIFIRISAQPRISAHLE